MSDPIKKDWLDRAIETFKFHRSKLLSQDGWTATLTAKALNRSEGSVFEDLKIARYLRTNQKEIEQFEFCYQALKFIREKEKRMRIEEEDV